MLVCLSQCLRSSYCVAVKSLTLTSRRRLQVTSTTEVVVGGGRAGGRRAGEGQDECSSIPVLTRLPAAPN
jgi:hypothetical protein